jgi:Flp pilus assembly protein TadD
VNEELKNRLALGVDGQTEPAIDAVNTALRLDPSFTEAYLFGGAVQLFAGHAAPGTVLLQHGAALAPADPMMIGLLGQAYALSGDAEQSRAMVQRLDGLPAGIPRSGARAHVDLGLRDTTAAFAALEQAVADREPIFAAEPLGTPLFATIRRTPHFSALLGKIGFSREAANAIRTGK